MCVSALFARRSDDINRLYFSDLAGAALACLVVVPARRHDRARLDHRRCRRSCSLAVGIHLTGTTHKAALAVGARRPPRCSASSSSCPTPPRRSAPRRARASVRTRRRQASEWSALFRVDAAAFPDNTVLYHDGIWGSAIWPWDGDPASLDRFDTDDRSIPFAALGEPPERVLIIGAAGGNEIAASIHFGAEQIDAVELNPATAGLLRGKYAEYSGHLTERAEVNYVVGDGRSYLARSDEEYDLVWFVAPDSYAASNAASSGAFVLSESYLYTEGDAAGLGRPPDRRRHGRDAVRREGLRAPTEPHRPPRRHRSGGVRQRGHRAVRRAHRRRHVDGRGVLLRRVDDHDEGVAVHRRRTRPDRGPGRRRAEQRSPVTCPAVPATTARRSIRSSRCPTRPPTAARPSASTSTTTRTTSGRSRTTGRSSGTSPVLAGDPGHRRTRSPDVDVEIGIGERVLLVLLAISILLATVFLLVPFLLVRTTWRALPDKATSAPIFALLGLAFIAFEITLIQRFSLFLGLSDVLADGDAHGDPAVDRASARSSAVAGTCGPQRMLGCARPSPSSVSARSTCGSARCWRSRCSRGRSPAKVVLVIALCAPLGFCLGHVHAARHLARRHRLASTPASTWRGAGRSTGSSPSSGRRSRRWCR